MFEGSRHETLHDKEQERARELIKEWVLSHLTGPPVPEPQSQEPQLEEPPQPQSEPSTEEQLVKQHNTEGLREETEENDQPQSVEHTNI